MIALVEINFNTNTKNIIGTLIEGIAYHENNYKKPSATKAKWSLRVKTNVLDGVLNVACMAIGKSLHKADASITVKYRKNNALLVKTENIEDDTFTQRGGIVIFKKEITL